MKISLSQFMAFTARTTTAAKMKQVLKIKNNDYTFAGDYWMGLRNRLHQVLQGKMTFTQLEQYANSVEEDRGKRKNYISSTYKLKAFFNHQEFTYFDAPKSQWIPKDQSIIIKTSPEFGLEMNDVKYLIKVFYRVKKKDEQLTKRNIGSSLVLMDNSHYSSRPVGSIPAILNLQTNKLVTINDIKKSSHEILNGDIAMFKALWEVV